MTKAKGRPFKGAWLNERIDLPTCRALLVAHGAGLDPEQEAVVLGALAREVGRWRFEVARANQDPEPAQWHSLLAAIWVPGASDRGGVLQAADRIQALPARVVGEISWRLFQRGVNLPAMLTRIRAAPASDDLELLRAVLAEVTEAASLVRGKRGPRVRRDTGEAIAAITSALECCHLGIGDRRLLAAELLRACGIDAPTDRRRLAGTVRGK